MKIIYLLMIILFLYGTAVYANVNNLIEKLNLNHAQVKKLRDQELEHTKAIESLQKRINNTEIVLKKELAGAKPENQRVKKLTHNLSELRDQMLELKVDAIMDMKKVMNPDQLKKMEKIIANNDKKKIMPPVYTRSKKRHSIKSLKPAVAHP